MKDTLDTVLERPAPSPYSAKRMSKPVNFYCHAKPAAKSVNLAGDFNDWDQTALPMQRQEAGILANLGSLRRTTVRADECNCPTTPVAA